MPLLESSPRWQEVVPGLRGLHARSPSILGAESEQRGNGVCFRVFFPRMSRSLSSRLRLLPFSSLRRFGSKTELPMQQPTTNISYIMTTASPNFRKIERRKMEHQKEGFPEGEIENSPRPEGRKEQK